MNKIPSRITHISAHSGCELIQMQCAFGTLYGLVIESNEFTLESEVMATFKENEVIILQGQDNMPLGIPNAFKGKIQPLGQDCMFARVAITPITHTESTLSQALSINALIPSLLPLSFSQETYTWYVSPAHIVLERTL
ncbi:hypothetical protein [uncultured Helicobacter sp.]|uniref:hypothetical protein n=1 Tax=uncultured Helicobacter sp. TaxID=175537 RepID=UPI002605F6A7|nr:hypothetical protein [uncultured Helicobacter sp.]